VNPECNVCGGAATWDTPTIWSGFLAFLCDHCHGLYGAEGGTRLTRPRLVLV
jgi:hypothetical protein